MARTLGALTYQPVEDGTAGGGVNEFGLGAEPERWAVRGNYRIKERSGNDLQQLVNGQWVPLNDPNIAYDTRTDGATADSNERRRFVRGFIDSPDGTSIEGANLQTEATNRGWTEPNRSGGGFGDILPIVALVGLGIATGGFGLMGAGAEAGALAAGEAAAGTAAAETAAMSSWAGLPAASSTAGTGLINSTLTNAGMGAISSAVRGGNPITGAITGAAGGLAGGAAGAAGAGPLVSKIASTAASGLIGQALAPDVPTVQRPSGAAPTANAPAPVTEAAQGMISGLSFSDLTPHFNFTPRADMNWGDRLNRRG